MASKLLNSRVRTSRENVAFDTSAMLASSLA